MQGAPLLRQPEVWYTVCMREWLRERLMRRRSRRPPNDSESTGKIGQELPTDQPAPLRPSYPEAAKPEPVKAAPLTPKEEPQTALTAEEHGFAPGEEGVTGAVGESAEGDLPFPEESTAEDLPNAAEPAAAEASTLR